MEYSTILILSSCGKDRMHIVRLARGYGVRALILPCSTPAALLRSSGCCGIILPSDCSENEIDPALFSLGIPVLSIGAGTHMMLRMLGGSVFSPTLLRPAGSDTVIERDTSVPIFTGLNDRFVTQSDIRGGIGQLPEGFSVIARSDLQTVIAVQNTEKKIWGITTEIGEEPSLNFSLLIRNFLVYICRARTNFKPDAILGDLVDSVRAHVGRGRVLTTLLPTVGSVVGNALLARALPGQVTSIFIDTGLMRENEGDEFVSAFGEMGIRLIRVNAADRFLDHLAGALSSREKNQKIRTLSGEIFFEEASRLGSFDFFSYNLEYEPMIAANHYRLPGQLECSVGEITAPLRIPAAFNPVGGLTTEEARQIGTLLGLPRKLTNRHFYPLAGVATRISGELTREKFDLLRASDRIVRDELERSRVRIDKYFVVLLESALSISLCSSEKSYSVTIVANRGDGMNGMRFARIPYPLLEHISDRLTAELPRIKRVFFDITNQPSDFLDQVDWN